MTISTSFKGQAKGVSAAITSNALSVSTDDFICIAVSIADNGSQTAWTVTNTGTAIVWTNRAETNAGLNAKVVVFTGTAGATPPTTVTVTATAGLILAESVAMLVAVHTGAHATTPFPAGNMFKGTGGTDVSQAVTPTSSGSALWMMAGDWSQTNSFAAAANCALVAAAYDESGQQTAAAFQPTTQPRTDALAFTIGETDTGGKIAWVVWEVQAAAGVTRRWLLVR